MVCAHHHVYAQAGMNDIAFSNTHGRRRESTVTHAATATHASHIAAIITKAPHIDGVAIVHGEWDLHVDTETEGDISIDQAGSGRCAGYT